MFLTTRFYVRDGALIGDLRDSLQPMIWRMELSRVHAVGFKVQQNGSTWDLGMEGSNGNFATIASYSSQAAANKALAGIGHGLRCHGLLRRMVKGTLLLGVLIVLVYAIYSFVGGPLVGSQVGSAISSPGALLPQTEQPIGQSMSADQALRAPAPSR